MSDSPRWRKRSLSLEKVEANCKDLTPSMLELVGLIHLENHRIAKILGVSSDVVGQRFKRIYDRMQVPNKTALALELVRLGIIQVRARGRAKARI